MKKILLCYYLSFLAFYGFGQELDSEERKLKAFALPIAYYTPETEWGIGAVSLFSFRFKNESQQSRNSQFQFGGAYTQLNQLLLYLPFQLYYKNEKYYSFGELGYYNYSYRFFGVGGDLPQSNEEFYDVDFPRVRLNIMKLIKPRWYLGFRYWFDSYNIVRTKDNGLLESQQIIGSQGGIVSSLGVISIFDSRDNYNYPTKGTYVEVLALPNLKAFGSDFEFTRFSADYVKFLGNDRNVVALNLFAVSILGEAPFNELALIGGAKKMRGYFEGRYRDRNLMMAQAEYRRDLFWRIGVVAFAGYGLVSRSIDAYQVSNLKPSGGLGLRYLLNEDEKINLRLDVGYGEKANSGIYLTIGEAF